MRLLNDPTVRVTMGKPGTQTCPDCGADVPKVCREVGQFDIWEPELHQCAEQQARKKSEREEAERKSKAFLENPPATRIEEVRRQVRLPHWTPAGMKQVIRSRVPTNAFNAFARHRKKWLAGERPDKGIWAYGPSNSGKTVLTSALLFDIQHQTKRPALLWNLADLMKQIRLGAQDKVNDYDAAEIADAEVIALDDLGTIKTTERVWETIFDIVCAVGDAWGSSAPRQVLYVTSNEGPGEMTQRLSTPENPDGGERIVRRLLQLTEQVEVRG